MNSVPGTTIFLAAALAFAPAALAEKPHNRPELFSKLIDCRSIADNAQRLACYDRSVGAMEEAEKKNDLVVVDRKEVSAAKKSLFGFTLPRISLFDSDKDDDKDAVVAIDNVVQSARVVGNGNWSLALGGDAGTWETLGSIEIPPKPGDKVHIAKASLGSYLGRVGINRGVRFRRVK